MAIMGVLVLAGSVIFSCYCLCGRLCCGAWPGLAWLDSSDNRNMDSGSLDAEANHKPSTNSDDSSSASSSSGHTSLVISTSVTSPTSLTTQPTSAHSDPLKSHTHSYALPTSTNHNTTSNTTFSATINDPDSMTTTFAPSTPPLPPSLPTRPLTDVCGPWAGFPHMAPSYAEAMAHS